MSIRKMELEDLRKVVELEHALFLSPWSEEDFSHELKENPMAGYYVLEKENEIEKEQGTEEKDKKQILKYIIILIGATILIFITGNILSDSLETLCNNFGVSQIIIGILLGVITSAPEFITFNEAQKYHKKESKEQLKGVVEATNNLISSNMLNLLVIQSIGILIYLISY